MFFIVCGECIGGGRYIMGCCQRGVIIPFSSCWLALSLQLPSCMIGGNTSGKFHSHLRYPTINYSLMNITIKLNISARTLPASKSRDLLPSQSGRTGFPAPLSLLRDKARLYERCVPYRTYSERY